MAPSLRTQGAPIVILQTAGLAFVEWREQQSLNPAERMHRSEVDFVPSADTLHELGATSRAAGVPGKDGANQ